MDCLRDTPLKVLFIVLCLLSVSAVGEIYRWVDDQGRVHFSDSALEPDAEQVEVRVQTVETVRVEYLPEWSQALVPEKAGVVMYSTSWCGVCRRAERYFQEQGIAYTEKDIETNPAWREEYDQLGGSGVPLIVVGDQRMSGFSSERFQRLYSATQR